MLRGVRDTSTAPSTRPSATTGTATKIRSAVLRLIDSQLGLAPRRGPFAQHRHRRALQRLGHLLLAGHRQAEIGIGGRRDHDAVRIDDTDARQGHLAHIGQHRRQDPGRPASATGSAAPAGGTALRCPRQDGRIGEIELRQERAPAFRRFRRG